MKNFKVIVKHGAITAGEVGVITGGIIVTKKFLDFKNLFKNQIAANPDYANKFHIKHQGIIKVAAGTIGASMVKNPWIKLALIGMAVEGAITEIRVLTTNKETGASFFDQIGAGESQMDLEMLEAAKMIKGNEEEGMEGVGADYGDRYATMVSGNDYGDRYATSVGQFTGRGGNIDLNDMQSSYVSGFR